MYVNDVIVKRMDTKKENIGRSGKLKIFLTLSLWYEIYCWNIRGMSVAHCLSSLGTGGSSLRVADFFLNPPLLVCFLSLSSSTNGR